VARAQLSNPGAAARDLSKLASAPRGVFSKATSVAPLGGGFFAIHEAGTTITAGVLGNQLLVGKATPSQLRSFAASPAAPAAGGQGSVVFRVALVELLRIALKQSPPKIAQTILSSLGDITGWISSTPSGITGSATVGVR
jgi:hypothetical protein